MKNKKFVSLLMALAMVFSMSVSVFADDTPAADPNKFEATATVKIPTIDVSVPETAPLFINPMGFNVKIGDGTAAGADDTYVSNAKVVSPVFTIENASPMNLDVNVIGSLSAVNKAAGAAADSTAVMSIATAPIAETDTKNSVFIYAQFGAVTEDTSNDGKYTMAASDYTAPAENATTFPQLALTTKAPTKPVNVGSVVKTDDPDTPTLIGFQFRGDCNANAKNDWADGESVTATLIFSFKPAAAAAAATTPASGD